MHVTNRVPFRFVRRLARDRSGLALIEFAYSLPLVLGVGCYGVETANLALTNMKVSQIALNLADNASRVGLPSTLNTTQLREVDLNDVLQAARTQGNGIKLTTNGRITLFSLEKGADGIQRVHWQRCIGLKNASYEGAYSQTSGTLDKNDGTSDNPSDTGVLQPDGLGDAGSAKVQSPPNSGVMYVEINYQYQPLIGPMWTFGAPERIHFIASFIVRDRRDFAQIYNPDPKATPSTCDLHTT